MLLLPSVAVPAGVFVHTAGELLMSPAASLLPLHSWHPLWATRRSPRRAAAMRASLGP